MANANWLRLLIILIAGTTIASLVGTLLSRLSDVPAINDWAWFPYVVLALFIVCGWVLSQKSSENIANRLKTTLKTAWIPWVIGFFMLANLFLSRNPYYSPALGSISPHIVVWGISVPLLAIMKSFRGKKILVQKWYPPGLWLYLFLSLPFVMLHEDPLGQVPNLILENGIWLLTFWEVSQFDGYCYTDWLLKCITTFFWLSTIIAYLFAYLIPFGNTGLIPYNMPIESLVIRGIGSVWNKVEFGFWGLDRLFAGIVMIWHLHGLRHKPHRKALNAVGLVGATLIFLSLWSRQLLIAIGIGIAAYMIATARRRALAAVVTVTVGVAVFFAATAPLLTYIRFGEEGFDSGRGILVQIHLHVFEKSWITGSGWRPPVNLDISGIIPGNIQSITREALYTRLTTGESSYTSILASRGALRAGLVFGFLMYVLVSAARSLYVYRSTYEFSLRAAQFAVLVMGVVGAIFYSGIMAVHHLSSYLITVFIALIWSTPRSSGNSFPWGRS